MAVTVFVGAYAYARQVLDAMLEKPAAVVTTRNRTAPRYQHIEHDGDIWTNGDVESAVMMYRPDLIVVAVPPAVPA